MKTRSVLECGGPPSPIPTTLEQKSGNPKGIPPQSPGLARRAYPGENVEEGTTPSGLRPSQDASRHNPLGVGVHFAQHSQGSSCLATLGFGPESLWDSRQDALELAGNGEDKSAHSKAVIAASDAPGSSASIRGFKRFFC